MPRRRERGADRTSAVCELRLAGLSFARIFGLAADFCMVPLLLDALTFIFLVGGLALLWVNLRNSRRRNISVTVTQKKGNEPEHGVTPLNVDTATATVTPNEEYLAGTSQLCSATCRAQAGECLRQAERSTNQSNRETWLLMAAEWIKLGEKAKQPI
jgi:hypothetical protein